MKKTNALRKIWYNLSANQRFLIRRLYYFPSDFKDTITGKRHKYVAPRGYIYTGSPASSELYLKQGQQQVGLLKQFVNLKPEDQVLDIGSGVGRTAIALTEYLNEKGGYCGFDAVEEGVKWCNKTIGKDFSNFKFDYVPLDNDLYNKSDIKADDFVFQYEDEQFDKVFLFSVFTHMMVNEIENYLKEIKRVLKPGGMCFTTLFYYNEENENYIASMENFNFPVAKDGYRLMSDKVKSANIAISELKLEAMISASGLTKVTTVDGFWKDKDKGKIEYQDILVLEKK
jgi:ubiquinone/menaquinone biosynthesis C-methylase UbiE